MTSVRNETNKKSIYLDEQLELGGNALSANILEVITEQYHSLTRSGKKLADYIFANTYHVQYMSISNLAENRPAVSRGGPPSRRHTHNATFNTK